MFNFLSQPVEKVLQKVAKFKLEGKLDKAISLLEKSAKEIPDNLHILIELGSLYFHTDQCKSACTIFKKAQRGFPSAAQELLSTIESLHFERGRPVESGELLLEIYAERRDLEQSERVLSSFTEAQLHSVTQRYDQMYKNSIKYKADSLQRSLTLAYCLVALYSAMHDYRKSFVMLEKILELSASEHESILKEGQRIVTKEWGNPLLLISLGDLYAKRGLAEKATENYLRAVESDSTKTQEVTERIKLLLSKSESETLVRASIQLMISSHQFQDVLRMIERLKALGSNRDEIARLYSEVIRLDPSSSQAHLLLGDHFFQEKRFDSAASEYVKVAELDSTEIDTVIERLENTLIQDPGNEYVLDITFDIFFPKGNLVEAVKILADAYRVNAGLNENIVAKLKKILEKDLTRVDALTLLGKIYSDRGESQNATLILSYLVQISEEGARVALPLLTGLVERDPELIQARVALADTHVTLKDFEKALEIYFETLDANPKFCSTIIPKIDLLIRERWSLALRAAELYSEKEYLDPFVRHYARAEALALAERFSEAAEDLNKCIEYRPDSIDECSAAYHRMLDKMNNADVRLALGDVYIKVGRFKEALEELKQTVSVDPKKLRDVLERLYKLKTTHDAPWLRTAIIDLLIKNHLHSEATGEIHSAQEKFPSHRGSLHLALARIKQDLGLFEEAVLEAKKAMKEDHSLATAVISILEEQKKMDITDLPCLITLVQAYRFSKRYNNTIDELRKIAEIYPEKIDWVVDELKKVSEDDPTNPKLSYVRGQLLLTKGETREAVDNFSKACNLDDDYFHKVEEVYVNFLHRSSDSFDILLALARIKIEKGAFAEATHILVQLRKRENTLRGPVVRELRRIIDKDSQCVEAIQALAELYVEEEKYDLSLLLLDKLIDLNDEKVPWIMKQLKRIHKKESDNPKVLRTLGYGYLQLGDLKKSCHFYDELMRFDGEELSRALTDLKEMVDRYPDRSEPLFVHARMLLKKKLVEEACEAFRRLANMKPSVEQEVIGELQSMINLAPEAEFLYLLLGELLERRGENKKAIDILLIGLKRARSHENVMEFHILLASGYNALKEEKKAQKQLKMAKSRAESKERFFKRLLELDQERLNFEMAKLRDELERNPDNHFTRIRLAELLRKIGNTHEAIEVLRVPMEDSVAKKKRALEVSLCLADEGELLTALETLNSIAIGTPPEEEDLEILYTLAILYRRIGSPLQAIACLKLIRKADPEYKEAKNILKGEYKQLILLKNGITARTVMRILS